eukprot:11189869-Lingulodinium_polyedra.AAC.1
MQLWTYTAVKPHVCPPTRKRHLALYSAGWPSISCANWLSANTRALATALPQCWDTVQIVARGKAVDAVNKQL